jgi:hypothetical protein
MPKLNILVPKRKGSGYPPSFAVPWAERVRSKANRRSSKMGETMLRVDDCAAFPKGNGHHFINKPHPLAVPDNMVYGKTAAGYVMTDGSRTRRC